MSHGNVVYWLHGDHRGSTWLATNLSGTMVVEVRYTPYGGTPWVSGTLLADFTSAWQRAEGFGLMDYHARYHSSSPPSIIH